MKLFSAHKNLTPLSLSDDYFSFMWIISRGILIISFIAIYMSFSSLRDTLEQDLDHTAHRISGTIIAAIERNSAAIKYLGGEMVRGDIEDPQYVQDILKKIRPIDYQNNLFRNDIVWATPDNQILASNENGLSSKPISGIQNSDKLLSQCIKKPWTVFINPHIQKSSFPPYSSMVHLTMSITNDSEQVVGRLGAGIDIKLLSQHIATSLPFLDHEYLVLDQNLTVIFASEGYAALQGESVRSEKNPNTFKKSELQDFSYSKFQKIPQTPFFIMVGTKEKIISKNFLKSVLPKVLEIFIIGIFCLIILYIYRKKFLAPITKLVQVADQISKGQTSVKIEPQKSIEMKKLAKGFKKIKIYAEKEKSAKEALRKRNEELTLSHRTIQLKKEQLEETEKQLKTALLMAEESETAKEKFRNEVLKRSRHHLKTIIDYTHAAKTAYQRHNALGSFNQNQIKLLSIIQQEATKLERATLDVLEFSRVSINDLLGDCIRYHLKRSHENKTIVETEFEPNLPPLLIDQTSLKQAFINLIEQSINFTPKGTLKIQTRFLESEENIRVSIIDNGFGLSQEEMERISAHISPHDDTLDTPVNYEFIQKIIALHHGTISIDERPGIGRSLNITLPTDLSGEHQPQTGNIYTLPSRRNNP